MIGFANAKINIGLFITEKRDDGFHNLETIFFPVSLYDVIEFIPSNSSESSLKIEGVEIPGDSKDNLILRAYRMIENDFDLPPLDFHLIKNIPTGAGMGGGSSDAVKVLFMLNEYFALNLEITRIKKYAMDLGSDCPFFMINQPCFATGRGEILQPIHIKLSGYYLKIINPGIHISTKDAFSKLTPKTSEFNLSQISEIEVSSWKKYVSNDFEESVFASHPEVSSIKQHLYESGAVYASMSGSGSSVYGIFETPPLRSQFDDLYFSKTLFLN